jgi:stalled ribosome alternative rescue factor ArfA
MATTAALLCSVVYIYIYIYIYIFISRLPFFINVIYCSSIYKCPFGQVFFGILNTLSMAKYKVARLDDDFLASSHVEKGPTRKGSWSRLVKEVKEQIFECVAHLVCDTLR